MEWILTDAEWAKIESVLPKRKTPFRRSKRKGGRPRLPDKKCFEAMLWVMFGGHWRQLPKHHGSPRAVLARIHEWERRDLLLPLWHRYLRTVVKRRCWMIERMLQDGPCRPRWEKYMKASYFTAFSFKAHLWFRQEKARLTASGLRAVPFAPKPPPSG